MTFSIYLCLSSEASLEEKLQIITDAEKAFLQVLLSAPSSEFYRMSSLISCGLAEILQSEFVSMNIISSYREAYECNYCEGNL